jgi:hypothetical protein
MESDEGHHSMNQSPLDIEAGTAALADALMRNGWTRSGAQSEVQLIDEIRHMAVRVVRAATPADMCPYRSIALAEDNGKPVLGYFRYPQQQGKPPIEGWDVITYSYTHSAWLRGNDEVASDPYSHFAQLTRPLEIEP